MRKAEIIERYGIERYKEYRAKSKAWSKNKYDNDPEYRLKINNHTKEYQRNRYHSKDDSWKSRVNERNKAYKESEHGKFQTYISNKIYLIHKYCRCDEESKIENYELAKADNFRGWDIHHRLELTINDEYAHSKDELIRMNMYYDRPYYELIFLRHNEHTKLHSKTRPGSFVNRQ